MAVGTAEVALGPDFSEQTQSPGGVELKRVLESVQQFKNDPDHPSLNFNSVHGMTRSAAAELADRFGQVAIFELSADELLVVRSRDCRVMQRRPRRSPDSSAEPGGA